MSDPRRPPLLLCALLASTAGLPLLMGYTRLEMGRVARGVEEAHQVQRGLEVARGFAATSALEVWLEADRELAVDDMGLDPFRSWLDRQGLLDGDSLDAVVDQPARLGGHLESLRIHRDDRPGETLLTLGVVVRDHRDDRHGALRTFVVERRPWEASDAVLAGEDISCTWCHLRVESPTGDAARVVSTGPLEHGPGARITIDGVLHLGAGWGDGQGGADPVPAGGLGFAALDSELRCVEEAPSARARTAPARVIASRDAQVVGAFGDGTRSFVRRLPRGLPGFGDSGPAPGVEPAAGSLRGGLGRVEAPGARAAEMGALDLAGRVSGNLVAVGTDASPLRLAGDVVVDGDAVIVGRIDGEGSIRVRGSLYVPGSLRAEPGALGLFAGADALLGHLALAAGPTPFVLAALERSAEAGSPDGRFADWITAAELSGLAPESGELRIDAAVQARGTLVAVAPGIGGQATVQGALRAAVVAVHAPGGLVLVDRPRARDRLTLHAPLGLSLSSSAGPPKVAPSLLLGPGEADRLRRRKFDGPR